MSIHILPQKISDQIAAGEVVENPRSVIKELVENAIDAKAQNIEIWIEDGGKTLIKVIDDGMGMNEADAKKCTFRHATSKISQINDLFSIQTFGFRGEALAAISSVSHFELTTKTETGDLGTLIKISAGETQRISEISANEGTQILIKDLFFPTPARLKYLKTPETEYRGILKEVKSFMLSNPNVSFKLFKDGKNTLDTPAVQNKKQRIKQILPRISDDLLEVNFKNPSLKISGFICRPEKTIHNRTQQYLFVNERKIEDNLISFAVREAYQQSCGIEKHLSPIFVLFIETDPILVDVNVHPRKLEVKFAEPRDVFSAIKKACSITLEKISHVPQSVASSSNTMNFGNQDRFSKPQISRGNYFNKNLSGQTHFHESFASRHLHRTPQTESSEEPSYLNDEASLGNLILIGQVNRKYILAENEKGLFIFDQHALHERQRFEKFWKEFEEKPFSKQKLLIPLKINLSEEEVSLLHEQKSKIQSLGFFIKFIEDDTIELLEIPNLLEKEDLEKLFQELVTYFNEEKIGEHGLDKLKRKLVEYKSCRGAIMYGDNLAKVEMEKILSDLKNTKFKWLCAHGRPNYIFYPFDALDKQFHR
ncbi:DNA mismatch repair endonuclease MutL [Candidatus Gracilibacteria bacterium]|nr:DNA mismatch repair endonuclease MutL [Candidatus Gracilibacteria bacterium]